MSGAETDRRSELRQLKLSRLVGAEFGSAGFDTAPFPSGAALCDPSTAYVYIENATRRSLGPALMWALNRGIRSLNLFVDDGLVASELSRRAGGFETPPIVHLVDGAQVSTPSPAPFPVPADAPTEACTRLARNFSGHGLETVEEWGILRGELRGLEVARVVDTPEPHIETGVGDFDREISAMMLSGASIDEALASVTEILRQHRHVGAPPHPMRDLVMERWQRARAVEEPATVHAVELIPVDLSIARTDLRSNVPAAALGTATDLVSTFYVFTAGLDVDLVPAATDAARFHIDQGATVDRIRLVGDPACFPDPQRAVANATAYDVEILPRRSPHLA